MTNSCQNRKLSLNEKFYKGALDLLSLRMFNKNKAHVPVAMVFPPLREERGGEERGESREERKKERKKEREKERKKERKFERKKEGKKVSKKEREKEIKREN